MSALSELHNRVSIFVSGAASSEEFGDWFVDSLWDVEQTGDKETRSAFYMVEGVLAEASHARWSKASLLDELAVALRSFDQFGVKS